MLGGTLLFLPSGTKSLRCPDLAFETVVPGTRHDEHRFGPYTLKPAKASDAEALLNRAREFRSEAVEGLKAE